ncbi:MAG: molecular chaperone DnaK [Candidatus Syntropharchaeia archaeon]
MSKVIGIDLGTTNSEAAVMEGGRPVVILSSEGGSFGGAMFPSVVAFTKNGDILVGEKAKRQAVANPERTITNIKRKMGTDYRVTIFGKRYTPQEISAMILRKIKKDAESFLGEKVRDAVITVPAYFNDNQRKATKDAGRIAGLNVIRIINEPTAAALAYGLGRDEVEKVAVLDMGGGTFDVTLMKINRGNFEVIATSGDTHLGGTDMDNAIIDYILEDFRKKEGIDLRGDPVAMQRIRDAAEKAKIELSTATSTTISLPFIADIEGPKHIEMTLTRKKLEKLIEPVLKRVEDPIKRVFEDSGLKPKEIDRVILVGGPTRMPSVQKVFKKLIGKEAERLVDPMQCVAMGAAIQGAMLKGELTDLSLLDVTPLSTGIETAGGLFTKLIERNTAIPTRSKRIFSTTTDNQTGVEIHVLQGERPLAVHNVTLGRFMLLGIPPAPRGIPRIEVVFDIDADGIMHVSAKDLDTGKEQKIMLTESTKLREDEIEKMIIEAEKFAEEDKRIKERIETKNEADLLLYNSKKRFEEIKDKLTRDEKIKIETAFERLRLALEYDIIDEIKEDMKFLRKTMEKIESKMEKR